MQCLFALSEAQRSRRCGEKHMSETVTGYIDHVIFRNEDNGYTVMVLKGTKKEEELTCVGSFPAITQGASIEATGVYIHHPVYGKQFQISSFTEKMPEDTYGIERYLGSGAIRGIGAALAARIVRKFGDDTLRIVEEEPERLAEVKGISEKKAREIAAQVSEKAEMRKVMIFLQKYGISLNLGAKIYQKYKESVYTILQENPYRLAEDISGVGFKIADEIAKQSPDTRVKIFNISKTNKNDIMTEVFKSKAIAVGSPTVGNSVISSVAGWLDFLRELKFKNKKAAVFGTYGWSGESTKVLREELTKYGFSVVEPEIKCNWNPDADDFGKAEELVKALLA